MGSSESGGSSFSGGGANSILATTSLMEGIGQFSASRAQASYIEDIYQANAELYAAQGADILRRADVDAGKYKKKVKSLLGSQRARMAAAGIDISDTDSTAFQIQEETLRYGLQDVQQIKNNAFREALGLKTSSLIQQAEGRFKAGTARIQGMQSLVNGGLKGVSYGMSAYKDFKADKDKK